jgi:hypothetical protein
MEDLDHVVSREVGVADVHVLVDQLRDQLAIGLGRR